MADRIEKSVDLAAPVERVWRALTDHEEFGAWFRVRLDRPFRVGEVVTGKVTQAGYEHIRFTATVVAIEPPRRFVFTWLPYAIDPNVDYSGETPTTVELRLAPHGTGTRLTVTESGFDQVPAHRRAEAFRMNDSGWAEQMRNIQGHVGG